LDLLNTILIADILSSKNLNNKKKEEHMAVHVVIKRRLKMNQPETIIPLLKELNDRAQKQQGYISTHTLQSTEDLGAYMVISVWETEDDWKNWFLDTERKDIQDKIDSLIGERTFYEVFRPIY
jgi:heme-degrading monooxygenase HmoA